MFTKITTIVIICLFLFSPAIASGYTLFKNQRVRIDNVEVPLLICGKPIKIGDDFTINVDIINNRFLSRFRGELHVYLTYAGIINKEIGKVQNIIIPPRMKNNISIDCNIDELDANLIQEKYNIIVILYENKLLGWLKERGQSTIESVNIVAKCWEKDKVKITKFITPNSWDSDPVLDGGRITSSEDDYAVGALSFAKEKGVLTVNVRNDGEYEFDIMVRVDLVEKPSLDIPIIDIEGLGEVRKEIGMKEDIIISPNEQLPLNIICTLKKADRYKKEFNVQAILYVNINGRLYEVDKSTIQTIKVNETLVEQTVRYGFWAWVIFIVALGTFLLIAFSIKIVLPFLKVKPKEVEIRRKELEQKLKDMDEKDQKKKKQN